jgi:hypothetical protein
MNENEIQPFDHGNMLIIGVVENLACAMNGVPVAEIYKSSSSTAFP